jgi:hypothetical protein
MDSNEELEELRYHGTVLTPTEEIAKMLGLATDDLEQELIAGKSDRAMAILDGRMTRKTALRESILEMACRGSSPAQAEALRMLKEL